MKIERVQELIEVIIAFNNEDLIQGRSVDRISFPQEWADIGDNPKFEDDRFEFRVKPVPREFYISRSDIPDLDSYGVNAYVSDTPGFQNTPGFQPTEWIKVVEVLDE